MPHTNKKNRNKHRKYQAFQDTEGWTHVLRGPKLPSSETPGPQTSSPDSLCSGENCPAHSVPIESIQSDYQFYKKRFEEAGFQSAFEEIFESRILKTGKVDITNAICMGLGSLTCSRLGHGVNRCPTEQLAAFAVWIDFLRTKYSVKHVYLQDPVFHKSDIAFIKSHLGYTILEDPKAHMRVNSTTFLFTPFLAHTLIHSVLCMASPAVFISVDYHNWNALAVQWQGWLLNVPRLKAFWQSRTSAPLKIPVLSKHIAWLDKMYMFWEADGNNNVGHEIRRYYAACSEKYDRELKDWKVGPGTFDDSGEYILDEDFKEKLDAMRKEEEEEEKEKESGPYSN